MTGFSPPKRATVDEALKKCISRCQRGESEALAELYEHAQSHLYRFCLYLSSNPQVAEDLSQEVFLKIFDSISNLKEPTKFYSWAYLIARNSHYDRFRGMKNTSELLLDANSWEQALNETPAGEVNWQNAVDLQRALGQMSADERTLLILYFVEEFNGKEIGEMLNISENLVRNRVFVAKQKLLKILDP